MHRHGHKCDSSHYFNLFHYFISTFIPFWHLILLGAIVYKLTIYAYLCHLSLYCLQPMYYLYLYHSPLGPITLCGNDRALTGLWFNGQQHFGSTIPPNTHFGNTPILQDACRWLDSYFLGQRPLHMPPLAPEGTLFRQQIWQLLSHINYGCTTTYGALGNKWAHQQGRNTFSAQAVGNAIGHNPISIFIPCHRVIGSNGNLIGYAGGIDRKIALLKLERAVL